MNILLWVFASLLAAAFLAAGLMKVGQPKQKLADSGMEWVDGVSDGAVKLLGGLEILGAIGLILPAALGIAPVLTPLAALGLVLVMVGAVVLHARRKESQAIAINLVLLALAAVVAWGRFGPYAF